ncbi:MAG: hypothetical protein Q9219_001125 [cf. Caloplaca sp. 3 TL-2023]
MFVSELETVPSRNVGYRTNNYGSEQATDRKPSHVSGLEFDGQDWKKLPQVHNQPRQPGPPPLSVISKPISSNLTEKSLPSPPSRKFRDSKSWIIVILVGLLIITIAIASAVAAITVKKHNANNSGHSTSSNNSTSPAITPTSAAVEPPTCTAAASIPLSDCPSLNGTRAVRTNIAQAINADVNFSIKCNHDLKLPLIMGVRVYSFEDCIRACASQRTNAQDAAIACVGAVFKPNSGQPLTCWLKSRGDEDAEIGNAGVDAALVAQS